MKSTRKINQIGHTWLNAWCDLLLLDMFSFHIHLYYKKQKIYVLQEHKSQQGMKGTFVSQQ